MFEKRIKKGMKDLRGIHLISSARDTDMRMKRAMVKCRKKKMFGY